MDINKRITSLAHTVIDDHTVTRHPSPSTVLRSFSLVIHRPRIKNEPKLYPNTSIHSSQSSHSLQSRQSQLKKYNVSVFFISFVISAFYFSAITRSDKILKWTTFSASNGQQFFVMLCLLYKTKINYKSSQINISKWIIIETKTR